MHSLPFTLSFGPILGLFNMFLIIDAQYLVEILERTQLGGHRPVVRCDATGANFGQDVISFSFGMSAIGCALQPDPPVACGSVQKPEFNSTSQCLFDFAVVPRGNCTFSEKAYYVQTAQPNGFSALIVYNEKDKSPIHMSGSKYAELVQIPVVMINYACMQSLLYGQYIAQHGYLVTIKASPGYYDLIKYLVPFVAIVGICFVVLFISLMIRLCRERRRLARKRLPRSYLKKIPTKKYRKGDPEETCAICLEDFQESEKLRILPCRHAYHCKCIDPWLTKNRKVCPICKRRVGPRSNDSSDTDETDTERATPRSQGTGNNSPSSSAMLASRDDDPLLTNAQPMAVSGSSQPPYPQPPVPSLNAPTTSSFFTWTTNLLHLGNVASSSTQNTAQIGGTESSQPNNENHPIPASSQLPVSSAMEDLSGIDGHTFGPLRRIRNGLSGIRNKISELVSRHASDDSHPHVLLENEEDSSTVTREEGDTLSRRTFDTLDETSSGDGHSMTTMHSNRQFHSVTVEMETAPEGTVERQNLPSEGEKFVAAE